MKEHDSFLKKDVLRTQKVRVIVRLSALGDILLAVPVARYLLNQDIIPVWVIGKKFEAISPYLPGKKLILDGVNNLLKTVRILKNLEPESICDLQGKLLSFVLVRLLGVPGTYYRKRSFEENFKVISGEFPVKCSDSRPVWKRYLDAAVLPCDSPDPSLNFPADLYQRGRLLFNNFFGKMDKLPILVHPSASHNGKFFPEDGLRTIIQKLNLPVGIIGDNPKGIYLKDATDLRGKVPLELLPVIIKLSRGVITTDSGPMHLTRAVNRKFAAFFFQTDPLLGFSPIPGGDFILFSESLDCKPCSLHGQREKCPNGTWQCRNMDWKSIADRLAKYFQ
ncbi:MAG: glycosyltransferase family 9 protein [Candidatus Riflebacteria bacterium]|nr:glycosyltransferase family 9 protein [Candidatus Riflebacteria bacterium]